MRSNSSPARLSTVVFVRFSWLVYASRLLTSIDADGQRSGYDLELTAAVAAAVTSSDGFALHTYGDPNECGSPGNACRESLGRFSRNFISFREQIDRVAPRWNGKLVYLTETNTFTGPALASPYTPLYNYADNWLNEAFALVRDYNRTRGSKPEVRSLCWFVDRNDGGWGDFSLRGSGRLAQARQDLSEEFKNPANRTGGAAPPTCSTAATGTCAGVGMGFDPPRWLRHGDVVRIEIDGLGTLSNRFVDEGA